MAETSTKGQTTNNNAPITVEVDTSVGYLLRYIKTGCLLDSDSTRMTHLMVMNCT